MAEIDYAEREREQRAGCRRDARMLAVVLLLAFLVWLFRATFPALN